MVGGVALALPAIDTILAPSAFAACSPLTSTTGGTTIKSAFDTAAAASGTNPSPNAGSFTFVYGSNSTASPTTAYLNTEFTTPPSRFKNGSGSNTVQLGYTTADTTAVHLFPGGKNPTGAYYTLSGQSTQSESYYYSVTFTWVSGSMLAFYPDVASGGATLDTNNRTVTFTSATAPCSSGTTKLYFYAYAASAAECTISATVRQTTSP